MRNKAFKIGFIVGVVLGLIVLVGAAFVWFSGGSAQASAAVTAPVLKPSGTGKLFEIDSDKSEVRFIINEVLIGQPKAVIGKTDQVAGQMIIDFQNAAQSQLGMIRINVRTLVRIMSSATRHCAVKFCNQSSRSSSLRLSSQPN